MVEEHVTRSRMEPKKENEEGEVRWVKHYSSAMEILLVGEGDFSFALCLALAFHDARNITATSLDSYDLLVSKYAKAKSNVETLKKMSVTVLHGIDATKMKFKDDLKMRKFDRIIFNFPHAGFRGNESNPNVIRAHRKLIDGFLSSAKHMLRQKGEIHISHKTEHPYSKWNLQELASKYSLMLKEIVRFEIKDYPGYSNKRGQGTGYSKREQGKECDDPFPLGDCSTFMFIIGDVSKKRTGMHLPNRKGTNDNFSIPCGNSDRMKRMKRPAQFPQCGMPMYPTTSMFDSQFRINLNLSESNKGVNSPASLPKNQGFYVSENVWRSIRAGVLNRSQMTSRISRDQFMLQAHINGQTTDLARRMSWLTRSSIVREKSSIVPDQFEAARLRQMVKLWG